MIKYIALICLFPALAFAGAEMDFVTYGNPALVFVGLGLIVLEFILPTKGLLGLAGIVLFFCGTYSLADHPNVYLRLSWPVIITLDILVAGTALITSYLTYKGYNAKNGEVTDSLVNREAKIIEWNEINQTVEIGGTIWKASNPQSVSFQPDDKVIITAQDNLTLIIIPKGEIQ